jgi:hypothetical protein
MTRPRSFRVEVLESRATPGGVAFSGGAFLPPGLIRGYYDPNEAPPPVQVARDGAITFLPPGVIRGYDDPNEAPPPIQVARDGAITFLPPGVIRGVEDPNI